MTIEIICVGKLKEKYWQDAAAEYIKRLSRFCTLKITELPEVRLSGSSAAEEAAVVNAESEAMPELMEKCAFIQPRTAGPDAPITLPPHPNTPTAAAR